MLTQVDMPAGARPNEMGYAPAALKTPRSVATFKLTEPARWVLFAVILATTVARISNLNDEFGRTFEGTVCGPIVCAARNTVRYGLIATHFGYVENTDRVPPELFTFYDHHPALVPLSMAASAAVFGDEPWAYRLPAAVCSILATALLFLMIVRKFDWPAGLAAAGIYAFCPFSWLLGDMPDVVGPHVVFFGIATIECFSRWMETGKPRWMYLACAAWVLCAFSDWPAFFLVPVLVLRYLIDRPMRDSWRPVVFGALSAAVFGLHIFYLTRGGDYSVLNQFFHRINGKTDNGRAIGLADWYRDAIKGYVFRTFSIPVVALTGVYLVSIALVAVHQIRRLAAHDTTLMLLGWGILHVVIGFQSSHQHMWVWSVVLPGMACAAALGGRALWQVLGGKLAGSSPAKVLLAIVAGSFVLWSYLRAHSINAETLTEQPMIYSIRDLGVFIHNNTPSGQGVLTSDMTDESTQDSEPALWYYADRQIRNNIRSVKQLDAALGPGDYPLYYHIMQHGGPAPMWFVMPAEHREELPELTAELDRRYAHWFIHGYMLYYLDWSPQKQIDDERKRAGR